MNKMGDIQSSLLARSEDSDSCTWIFILPVFDGLLDEKQVLHMMGRKGLKVDGTRCQHDYDCCGNWYASRPRVVKLYTGLRTVTYVVTQAWYRNL